MLSTKMSRDDNELTLTCAGCAEAEALPALRQAVERAHDDATQVPTQLVVVDLSGLEFVSATCLKVFVSWLGRVLELDDRQRYRIRFRSNPRHAWQRRSLRSLAVFGAGVVEIEST